ncbi:MAG: glycosyltransferase [Candidatus Binatia bacterium]
MKPSVICFGEDWNRHPGSAQDIMERLSSTRKVLWIDSLGLRRPRLTLEDAKRIITKITNWIKGAKHEGDTLVVYTPLVLPFYGSRTARKINAIILRMAITRLIRKNDASQPVLWISCPAAEGVVGSLGEVKSIYYCADEHSVFPGLSKETVTALEHSLLRKVDLVIVTSKNLYDKKVVFNRNTYFIPHGVDFDHFSRASKPETIVPSEIDRIRKPIVGFYGLIQDLIDFELIRSVAETRADWSFVMIGPLQFDAGVLPALPNVHFVGRRDREELPNYVKGFDVCMIPYKLVDRTIYANPLKLRQYLASGKPIVSTPLPEVKKYDGLVKIAKNDEEFIAHVEYLLRHDSPEDGFKRMDSVREENWDRIMERIGLLI